MRASGRTMAAAMALWSCATDPPDTGSAPAGGGSAPSREALALSNRGAIFLQHNSPRRALTTLRRAIGLAPELPDAHFNLGLVLARLGQHAEAVTAFERAGQLGFGGIGLHLSLGTSLRALNRYAQADAAFSRALPLAPGRPDLHLSRGEVLRAMGRLDSALAAFERAVSLDSTLGAGQATAVNCWPPRGGSTRPRRPTAGPSPSNQGTSGACWAAPRSCAARATSTPPWGICPRPWTWIRAAIAPTTCGPASPMPRGIRPGPPSRGAPSNA